MTHAKQAKKKRIDLKKKLKKQTNMVSHQTKYIKEREKDMDNCINIISRQRKQILLLENELGNSELDHGQARDLLVLARSVIKQLKKEYNKTAGLNWNIKDEGGFW